MLYLHIPFCHRKCTYCAFYSTVSRNGVQDYVDALCIELQQRHEEQNHPIRTLYFGGGTPSILSLEQLEQIAKTIRTHYDIGSLEEATLEANPEDLSPEYLKGLKNGGLINRLSIGIQSLHDGDLRLLNRRHNAQQAVLAVRNAHDAGFDNISIDLIYGLPNQSLEDWQDNLQQISTLPICHLSAYALSIEQDTMLQRQIAQGKIQPADEAVVLAQYHALLDWCKNNRFTQYEISNFCRPGCRSRHNSRYWDHTPYLGVGAAAHSFGNGKRRWNIADTNQYIESTLHGATQHECEEIDASTAYNEYLMTALRTAEGIDKQLVDASFLPQLAHDIQRYIATGLIEETATHYRPTADGLLQADGMAANLFKI